MTRTCLLTAALLAGCGAAPTSYPDLGGATDIALGSSGQVLTTLGGVKLGTEYIDVGASATMTKNEGGLATFHVVADLSKDTRLKKWNDLLPATAKDASGKVSGDVKLRITADGVQDFFNKDGKQHTLVEYAAPVGKTWALTKSDGVTITRKVVARSDQDDFPYGLLLIKTLTVEQDSRIPGIKKFVYRANHRFGIVYVEVVADDGSSLVFYPSASKT